MILTVVLNPAVDKAWVTPGFAPGQINRIAEARTVPGGKGNNVARVARTLGHPVTATGLAAGHNGRWMEEALAALDIAPRFLQVPGETRTCPTIVDPLTGTLTQLIEPGPPVAPGAADAFAAHLRSLLPGADVVVLAGSLPPGLPADYYARLVGVAAGLPVILDTSGEALRRGAAAGPAVIKPNRDELQDLLGRDAAAADSDLLSACQAVREQGVGTVLASLGEAGALMVGPGYALRARPPRLAAVNTVGSGDALVAGLAVALARGLGPADSLRLAVACGAANALSVTMADVDPADVGRILPAVELEAV